MDIQDFIVNRDQHMRPLEYDLSENFNELVRYLNDMGVLDNIPVGVTSESEIVSISDAYPAPPRALDVYGKSTQDGTPTPDAPVEIVSVVNPVLTVAGKNLWGGAALRDAILAVNPSATTGTDANGSYVTNPVGVAMNNKVLLTGPFKSNTVYTIVLAAKSSAASAHAPNMEIRYTDGSHSFISQVTPDYAVTTTVTATGRTVASISCMWALGTDYYYYDQCGIFEGVVTASDYEPYQGHTVSLPTTLRSLPDGTKDTLNLSYLRPSTRDGWAWYSRELVQRVSEFLATSSNNWSKSSSASNGYYKLVVQITDGRGKSNAENGIMAPWFKAANSVSEYKQTANSCWVDGSVNFNIDPNVFSGTASEFGQWVTTNNIEFYMPLATPVTTQLDPIELPCLQSENATVWCDGGSAQPTLVLEYIRDVNAALSEISEAIADIVTE